METPEFYFITTPVFFSKLTLSAMDMKLRCGINSPLILSGNRKLKLVITD